MTRPLRWGLWLLAVALIVPGPVANALLDYPDAIEVVADVGFLALAAGAATTGALVTARVPGNAVGWILLALGAGIGLSIGAGAYAEVGATTALGPLPGERWMAWLGDVTFGSRSSTACPRSCSCCSRTGTRRRGPGASRRAWVPASRWRRSPSP